MNPARDGDMEKPNSKYLGPKVLKPAIRKFSEAENSVSIQKVELVNTLPVSALYSAAVLAYVSCDCGAES